MIMMLSNNFTNNLTNVLIGDLFGAVAEKLTIPLRVFQHVNFIFVNAPNIQDIFCTNVGFRHRIATRFQ